MLAALQVQEPTERRTLLHIAQAYLRLFGHPAEEQHQDAADKLWAAMGGSQGSQVSN
jgi:hypothetical protein